MGLLASLADAVAGVRCVGCGAPGNVLCLACGGVPIALDLKVDPLDGGVARWDYSGAPRALVLGLKLRGARGHATALGDGMVWAARRAGLRADCCCWVPGRPKDIRVRGFDHAEVLARCVASSLGLPALSLLSRSGDRPDQTSLSRVERRQASMGAFQARPVAGHVLLVDDLVTTGATAAACARALQGGGATSVELLVACRA